MALDSGLALESSLSITPTHEAARHFSLSLGSFTALNLVAFSLFPFSRFRTKLCKNAPSQVAST